MGENGSVLFPRWPDWRICEVFSLSLGNDYFRHHIHPLLVLLLFFYSFIHVAPFPWVAAHSKPATITNNQKPRNAAILPTHSANYSSPLRSVYP